MLEIVSALAGALVGIFGVAGGSLIKKSSESRETIVQLTLGIEHIGSELSAMREDMKSDRREVFGRLGDAEQRLSALESTPPNSRRFNW